SEIFGHSEYKAIHAGLECGIISQKYPNMKLSSIGPNIRYPHSKREKIEIESIFRTFRVVLNIINKIN
ncbi:MAG: aminoacyl-histidine dipeptidase, partial [Sulfurovaceae bacterium]|nr:aminoacyl-histidine dipeptidase [Sulfurovaceae bacterium]